MSERITNGYKRLFEIRLLHHYWLDEGVTIFDLMMEQPKKVQRLLTYDRRSFLAIAPTPTTATALRGLQCIYRDTALGCLVAIPEGNVVPLDTTWEFVVTVLDAAFFNYTALTLRPRRIYEFYDQVAKQTYRFKENVSALSNLTGVAQTINAKPMLFLSQPIPATIDGNATVETIFQVANELVQLTSDQLGVAPTSIGADASQLPVYLHQGDIPAITPPAGLSGVPAHGVQLTAGLPDNLFALIRLSATRNDDTTFSFVDNGGHAKDQAPVYQVRFKNRLTRRRYIMRKTGAEESFSPPLPLTYFGNAGAKQKPSAELVKIERSDGRITELVSEIYV